MAIAQLLKDPTIVAKKLGGDDLSVTMDFVARRVRRLIVKSPSIGDPARPGDILNIGMPFATDELRLDMPLVKDAFTTIFKRVSDDAKAGLHVDIDDATRRKHVNYRPPTGSGETMRRRLVLSIVYQASAEDITLAQPANIERLHRIVDRRLRIVERMMFDVGRYDHKARSWSKPQLVGHKDGPWTDGLDRAFEYPRVPRTFFDDVCAAAADGTCSAPLTAWHVGDDDNIIGPIETNPGSTARWRPNKNEPYELDYTPATPATPKAVDAINALFTTSTNYLGRNRLYCDQTIHSLHIEALVFAEGKRQTPPGDPAWLDTIVKTEIPSKPNWLCLTHPMVLAGNLNPDPAKFLVGHDETRFFEHTTVGTRDLQLGDHLVIYNHPAYEHTTEHGAWRLENAVVVQTVPELLVQGHGTRPLTMGEAKVAMLNYFNPALEVRRADVRPLARVQAASGSTVTVDSVARLRVGMAIELADAATEALVAPNRTVMSIDAGKRQVTYSGAAAAATNKHVVRRARTSEWRGKYEGIAIGSLNLLRRVSAASSDFAPDVRQLADWHVAWLAKPGEDAIRKDADRAKVVLERQLTFYTVENDGTQDKTVGWFPLWQPQLRGGAPVRKAGKIAKIQPTVVGADQIAPWTWFAEVKADKTRVPVIRPMVQ